MDTKELVTYYMRKVIGLQEQIQSLDTTISIQSTKKEKLEKREQIESLNQL